MAISNVYDISLDSSTSFLPQINGSIKFTTSLGQTVISTDNLLEGTKNIFYTTTRVDNRINTNTNVVKGNTAYSWGNHSTSGYLLRSGGTMIGNLILNSDPTISLQATTKQYTDLNDDKRTAVTGIKTGGLLSIGTPTSTFSLGSGTGIIVDSNTNIITNVSWSSQSNILVTNISTQPLTYIKIDSSGSIIQQINIFSNLDYVNYIPIGVLVHLDNMNVTSITYVVNGAININNNSRTLAGVIGILNSSGNIFSENGTNMMINKTTGFIYSPGSNWGNDTKDPDLINIPQFSPTTLIRNDQNDNIYYFGNDIDPNLYDNGTTLVSVTSGYWTIQRITLFQEGTVSVQYGQTEYPTFNAASLSVLTQNYIVSQNNGFGIGRAFLVVQQGTSDLHSDILAGTAEFREISKFGSIIGSGGSGSGTTTLEDAYNNSSVPQIITSSGLGALTIRRGSSFDTDNVFSIQNGVGSNGLVINGNGVIVNGVWNGVPVNDIYISSASNWNTAYSNRIISLTTSGSSGSSTLLSNVLNIPSYTLAGLGGISLTSLSTTTPLLYNNSTGIFSIQVSNTSQNGYLTSTDWNTFNNKQSTLVSGTNIKTVNGSTLLGSGNLAVGDALVGNPLSQFTTTTSAQLASIISDETGTGLLVFNNTPTLTTPKINVTSDATGDIYYRNSGGNFTRLGIGSTNQLLQVISGLPSWQTVSVGSVTSFVYTNGNGFTGTVTNSTTTPTLSLVLQNATTTQSGQLTSTDWNTFNNKQDDISLTINGSNGSATFIGTTLNIPTYTLFGLGGQPLLVSGTNIKTINSNSLLGSGNISVGDALVANPLSQFASTTSAQLLSIISDETGSGSLVFATSPTLVTPVLGVATGTSLMLNGATALNSSNYLGILGNTNSYVETNIQNTSTGTSASSDYVVTADNGNDTTNYIDLGINSSTYSDASYTISGANDGYLYVNGGAISIGTQSSGKSIIFHTGGTLIANKRGQIDGNGNVSFNQGVQTTGSPSAFSITGAAHTTLTASTESNFTNFNNAQTIQFATGALTTQRANLFQAPTYAFVGASTITTAATVAITGAATLGTNTTITNNYALWIQAGTTALGGDLLGTATQNIFNTVTTTGNLLGAATTMTIGAASGTATLRNTTVVLSGGTLTGATTQNVFNTTSTTVNAFGAATTATIFGTSTATSTYTIAGNATVSAATKTINIATNGVLGSTTNINIGTSVSGALGTNTINGNTVITQNVKTTGSPTTLTVNGATNTTLTLSTEAIFTNFNPGSSQFATGALTTQRAFVIQAPTYSFVGASTITTASTFAISAAPTVGTNATITNNFALLIQSGNAGIAGSLSLGKVTSPAATTLLDMVSTASGLGVPSMTTSQMSAISNRGGNVIFQNDGATGLQLNDGVRWMSVKPRFSTSVTQTTINSGSATLISVTLPINYLAVNGDEVRGYCSGIINPLSTVTFSVQIATVPVTSFGGLTSVAGSSYMFEFIMTRISATSMLYNVIVHNNIGTLQITTGLQTVSTVASNTLTIAMFASGGTTNSGVNYKGMFDVIYAA